MKTSLLVLCLLSLAFTGLAQTITKSVEYTLRYNLAQSRYEVYARPDFTELQYAWGSSQISVVAPESLANSALSVTSSAVGGWSDLSQVYNVQGSDFHGVGTNGSKVDLTAGVEVLLFTFALPGNVCVPGLRLFNTGTDPNSAAAGMLGGDFANTLYSAQDAGGDTNLYVRNYANTGTVCVVCNLTAPTLSK